MKQYKIDKLVLEITRKCNMTCNHCMRGDAQNINMTRNVIDYILMQTTEIYDITFTGGEPFLNLDLINYFIHECERLGVLVHNFYIATNGSVQTKEAFMTIAKLYALCESNEVSCIAGSNDGYHLDEWEIDWRMFKAFSFFRLTNRHPYEERALINQGRASGISRTVNPTFENLELEDNETIKGMMYVNVNGDVMTSCDLSYESQPQHIIGNIENFATIEMEV